MNTRSRLLLFVTVMDGGNFLIRSYPDSFNAKNRFEVWDKKQEPNVKLGEFFITNKMILSASGAELDAIITARLQEFGVL